MLAATQPPRLIYCAISGFGQKRTMGGQRPAYDQIVQGLSGAHERDRRSGLGAVLHGISDLRHHRGADCGVRHFRGARRSEAKPARGRFIDVSLLEATMARHRGWVVSNHLNAGIDPTPQWATRTSPRRLPAQFRTAPAPLNIAANEQKQYETPVRPDQPSASSNRYPALSNAQSRNA